MPTLKTVLRKLLPVFSTAFFYAVYYLISTFKFDVRIVTAAIPYDYLLQLVIAYLLYALSKRLWVFVVLQGLLMAVMYVGNAVKISFFGGPIVPDDAYAPSGPVTLAMQSGRFRLPPDGLFGGRPGAKAQFLVNGKSGNPYGLTRLRAGDTVVMDAAGGGGYGDPAERDAEALARDIAEGRVTQGATASSYALKR